MKSFRVSSKNAQLIRVGLAQILSILQLAINENTFPHVQSDLSWLPPQFDRGKYDQEGVTTISVVHRKLSELSRGGTFDASSSLELAACALGVRVAVTSIRHGHLKIKIRDLRRRSRHLLHDIEVARKRVKRSDIKELGASQYAAIAKRWTKFVRWLRVHILQCRCLRRRRLFKDICVRRARRHVAQFTKLATAELGARGQPVPDERTVREYVRLAIRYVRRGRTNFTMATLLTDEAFARKHFADFVIVREKKRNYSKRRNR